MNCKVCGTRLGILERWRYGDFCCEDHKSVFAQDLEQIDRQLTAALAPERPPQVNPQQAAAAVPARPAMPEPAAEPETTVPAVEAAPEPEPAMAGFVHQEEPSPYPPKPRLEKSAKAPADKPEKPSGLWKMMAKLAEQEALPAAALTNSQPPDRPIVLIAAQQETVPGPGGYFLPGAHPAYSPPMQAPVAHRGLPQCELTRVAEGFWGPAFALQMPMPPQQPRHWVDQQGWHWIADVSAHVAPTLESVLAAYPMAAPWAQWPLLAPGGPPQVQAPGVPAGPLGAQPGYTMQAGMGPAPPPGSVLPAGGIAPPPPRPAAAAGPAGPAGPGAGEMAGMGPRGVPHAPGGALFGAMGGLFGAGQMMGWGVSPFGQTGPLAAGAAGYLWRELPPPFFNALVDLSYGMQAMNMQSPALVPAVAALNWPSPVPERPVRRQALEAGLRKGGMVAIGTLALERPLPLVSAYTAGPETATASPSLPPVPALPRPRVPRKVAPPVLLPLGSRLGLPKPAEPLMATGAGAHGVRGG